MKTFDTLPKTVKKTVRYIRQDASYDQLLVLKRYLMEEIDKKEQEFYKRNN
ncbi:hypothetical protein ABE033_22055 [Priestia megaterium]|uniref:hypothetical protein n=1 Tax=Priestia megaterium TaxID=1404 RepID=UPI000A915786|nr:hypothetical protein [Priestia megaterium]